MVVYLDFNATTPIDKSVCDVISSSLTKHWGNPSSSYSYGVESRAVIDDARIKVAKMVGGVSEEIIFTSGGTESNNMIIRSAVKSYYDELNRRVYSDCSKDRKPHIITTNIEHDSVKLPLETLLNSREAKVTFVPVSKETGAVEVDDIIDEIRPNTCLITVMLANNETGVIQPIKQLGQTIKDVNRTCGFKIYFHTDAAQAIGKIPVDVQDLGVDYMTIVGHKFYGPRIGALYFKRGTPLSPLLQGGGQERGYRPGTENTCMISGLGAAAELVSSNIEIYQETMRTVCNYFRKSLMMEFDDKVIFHKESAAVDRLPNTLSVAFNFNNLTGKNLLKEAKEICASTGAACHSDHDNTEDNSVLYCSGVPKGMIPKTVRFSVGRETCHQDIDIAIKSLKDAIKKLCGVELTPCLSCKSHELQSTKEKENMTED